MVMAGPGRPGVPLPVPDRAVLKRKLSTGPFAMPPLLQAAMAVVPRAIYGSSEPLAVPVQQPVPEAGQEAVNPYDRSGPDDADR